MKARYTKGDVLTIEEVCAATSAGGVVWVVLTHVNPHDTGKDINRPAAFVPARPGQTEVFWFLDGSLPPFDLQEFGSAPWDLASSEDPDGNLLEFRRAVPKK